jgi:hypothetical protein
MNEHDAFDVMIYAQRKRAELNVQAVATITITETYEIGLDGEDLKVIEATELPGADRRVSVQNYVERLHSWGAPGERERTVTMTLKIPGMI